MLLVKNQLCYSPVVPDLYGHLGFGHGPFCKDDIQMWNLLYLSVPELDRYLHAGKDEVYAVWDSIPTKSLASIVACFKGDHVQHQFPWLRVYLHEKPEDFLYLLYHKKGWELLPPAYLIPDWMGTMESRMLADYDQHMIGLQTQTLIEKVRRF